MTATTAGWLLLLLAMACLATGAPQAALVVALAAGLVAVVGSPTPEQADARRRNQAHRR